MTDLMLSFPWEAEEVASPAPPPHLGRIVATSSDRVAWLRARSRGVTATDAARLSSDSAVRTVAWEKFHGTGFTGNAFTDHGRAREPEIAAWVRSEYAIEPSLALFHAARERRHLATPDGVRVTDDGTVELAEIKTTSKPWSRIPRGYLRQVWWQQYVLGAERTLVVWEQHLDFVPVAAEPRCEWVERDESQIELLVRRADDLLAWMRGERRP
nr:YqaJ viral recombinase family protein [Herbiconiux sp.]